MIIIINISSSSSNTTSSKSSSRGSFCSRRSSSNGWSLLLYHFIIMHMGDHYYYAISSSCIIITIIIITIIIKLQPTHPQLLVSDLIRALRREESGSEASWLTVVHTAAACLQVGRPEAQHACVDAGLDGPEGAADDERGHGVGAHGSSLASGILFSLHTATLLFSTVGAGQGLGLGYRQRQSCFGYRQRQSCFGYRQRQSCFGSLPLSK